MASNPDPGDGTMFRTLASGADSPPNCVFLADQDGISDKVLDTPNFMVNSATAQVTFRHAYNMEADATTDWDGCVLEVSVNGGAFVDILAAGGTFVSGAYNAVIFNGASNPLADRMAWSRDSGGYVTTTVNFPASLNGQTIKLRFRMGTDEAAAAPGWRIDNFAFTGASCGP